MSKKSFVFPLIFLLVLSLTACSINVNDTPPPTGEEIRGYYDGSLVPEDAVDVTLDTSMGVIELRLFPSEAPKAVENFITHAQDGYYDGQIFHRVIEDFMIQSGDPTGTGTGGESIWGEGFATEFDGNLYHFYGALSTANTGEPNSNGSQFFIVDTSSVSAEQLEMAEGWSQDALDIYSEVGGAIHLDGQHTVFGYVTNGMDVVNAIAEAETDSSDKPLEDIYINSITVS